MKGKRKEIIWSLRGHSGDPGGHWSSDIILTFTRRGIEVNGWYDGSVGLGPSVLILWDEILANKARVEGLLSVGKGG